LVDYKNLLTFAEPGKKSETTRKMKMMANLPQGIGERGI